MIYPQILAATLLSGVGSVWLAAVLGFCVLNRYTQHMLSLAAGALLSTALLNLLPEAFESNIDPHLLFTTLLAGLLLFFLLDKAELWHHGHEHCQHQYDDNHGVAQPNKHAHVHMHHTGGWTLLMGDSLHCFGDGMLIASAFLVNPSLGWMTAFAVLIHETPHHMGDLTALLPWKNTPKIHNFVLNTSNEKRKAVLKVSVAGAVTAIGGTVGYAAGDALREQLPYFLVLAASSFIYVALADLIPQLQIRLTIKQTWVQIIGLGLGVGLVALLSHLTGH